MMSWEEGSTILVIPTLRMYLKLQKTVSESHRENGNAEKHQLKKPHEVINTLYLLKPHIP